MSVHSPSFPSFRLVGGNVSAAEPEAAAILSPGGGHVIGQPIHTMIDFSDGAAAAAALARPGTVPPERAGWLYGVTKSGEAVTVLFDAASADANADDVKCYLVSGGLGTSPLDERAASNAALTRLFSNLSHEMLTPLNAIIGFSEIISNQHFGQVSEQYRNYSDDIHASGQYLLAMIKSTLELGKLSAGPDSLTEGALELPVVMENAVRVVSGLAMQKSSKVRIDGFDAAPTVFADEVKILQLFTNLLSNALKYSHRNSEIVALYEGVTDGCAIIKFVDTGIGMTAAEIKTAMMPFGRAAYTFNAAEPGTGLGLPIAQAIVESHGGWLRVESNPDHGTCVTIALPEDRILSGGDIGLAGLVARAD